MSRDQRTRRGSRGLPSAVSRSEERSEERMDFLAANSEPFQICPHCGNHEVSTSGCDECGLIFEEYLSRGCDDDETSGCN